MKTLFRVKNWDTFQHYKDRNPPWIKLHNHLLDDYEFEDLPDNAKCHLLCIWMLASRTSNEMVFDQQWVKRKIGANSTVDLELLRCRGFIEVRGKGQHASNALVSEEERRGETEKSREEHICADRFDEFWDLYDKKVGLEKCKAKFSKLEQADINLLFDKLPLYVKSQPEKQYRKNPITWLNGKCWNDEIQINSKPTLHNISQMNYESGEL